MKPTKLKLRSFDWYNNVKEKLDEYELEIMDVKINYNNRTCEIRKRIRLTPSTVEKFKQLRMPKTEDYRIKDIITSKLESKKDLLVYDGDVYRYSGSELSEDESLLIIFEGRVDPRLLNNLVRVQPAMNRDQTDDVDSYWLDAMIKDIEDWNDIWRPLNVEDIDVYVDVSLHRCFSAFMPSDIQKRIDATQKFLQAGRSIDPEAMNTAWWAYRRSIREDPITVDKVLQIGRKLLDPDIFPSYIEVDDPYRIGSIEKTHIKRVLPDDITVTARTDLNSENPIAKGYLTFQKNIFIEMIKEQLESL